MKRKQGNYNFDIFQEPLSIEKKSKLTSYHPGHRAELCNLAFEIYRAIIWIYRSII